MDDSAIRVAIEALDEALRDWIVAVFTVWMHDDTGQPERAGTGARIAIAAYRTARNRTDIPPVEAGHLRMILDDALERALRLYLVKLFGAWMHETGGRPNPRYRQLADKAIKAYRDARKLVDEAKL